MGVGANSRLVQAFGLKGGLFAPDHLHNPNGCSGFVHATCRLSVQAKNPRQRKPGKEIQAKNPR